MRERSPVACRAAGASALRGTQSRRRAQGRTPIPHSEANRELFPRGRRHFTTQWWAVTRGPTSEHTELRISARKEITVFQRKKEYDPSGYGETFFFFLMSAEKCSLLTIPGSSRVRRSLVISIVTDILSCLPFKEPFLRKRTLLGFPRGVVALA